MVGTTTDYCPSSTFTSMLRQARTTVQVIAHMYVRYVSMSNTNVYVQFYVCSILYLEITSLIIFNVGVCTKCQTVVPAVEVLQDWEIPLGAQNTVSV